MPLSPSSRWQAVFMNRWQKKMPVRRRSLRWITSHPPMKFSVVNGGQKRPAASILAKHAVYWYWPWLTSERGSADGLGSASALDAEVGCSRPIAEGEHWMDRERYVGVSGVLLKSDIYLALGISGQIQHMVGGNGAKTIIAVNKDKNARFSSTPIMAWWAISIRSSPELTELLKR
jgi:hypothetical protein